MLLARRALASSARPGQAFGGCPALPPALCRTRHFGNAQLPVPRARRPYPAAARRCFGARIRRRGDSEGEEGQAPSTSTSAPSVAAGSVEDSQVREALAAAISGDLQGVQRLGALASEARVAAEAEEALHQVLVQASGESVDEIRRAAGEALWNCWHESGDSDVNEMFRRGVALLEKEHHEEAARVFTEVLERLPSFAEAWNKRATARFLMEDFDGSLEDCEKVLALKPRHFGCLSGLGMCHQSRGDMKEAARWFRKALEVHPGMPGPRRTVQAMEIQALVNDRLRPRVIAVVQALNDGAEIPAKVPHGLSCNWELRKLQPSEDAKEPCCRYFVRVRILNQTSGPCKVRSLARFYVFRFVNGRMLPLTLLTEGQASFTLEPGDEHRFSWQLVSGQALQRGSCSMLLEGGQATHEGEKSFLEVDFGAAAPADATDDEVERMRLGYPTTGQLDLRRMDAGKPQPNQPHK